MEQFGLVSRKEIRSYLDRVRQEFGRVRAVQTGSKEQVRDFPLSSMYVPVNLSPVRISASQPRDDWPQVENLLDAIDPHMVVAILGDPGSGKSTVISWLSTMLADPAMNIYRERLGDMVPLPMILRDMKLMRSMTREDFLNAFISQRFNKDGLAREQLDRILANGQAFVMVDGFDEVSELGLRKEVADILLREQLPSLGQGNRWLVTSRLTGYEAVPLRKLVDTRDLLSWNSQSNSYEIQQQIVDRLRNIYENGKIPAKVRLELGISEEADSATAVAQEAFAEFQFQIREAHRLYVTPFGKTGVQQFVYNWYTVRESSEAKGRAEANDFLAKLDTRADLSELAQTPQILTMMCLVHRVYTELPDGRAELYSRVTDAYLENIPRNRGLTVPYPAATSKRWLGRVGFELQKRRVEKSDLGEEDDGILATRLELQGWLSDEAVRLGEPLENVDEFINFTAERGGLLMERGQDRFAFLHLSFQEYFAALHLSNSGVWLPEDDLYDSFLGDSNQTVASLNKDEFERWAGETVWQETYRLLFQLINVDQIGRAVAYLMWPLEGRIAKLTENNRLGGNAEANLGHLLGYVALDAHASLTQQVRVVLASRLVKLEEKYQGLVARTPLGWDSVTSLTPFLSLLSLIPIHSEHLEVGMAIQKWESLNLSGNQLFDVSPLAEFKSLKSLDLSGTQISDLSPLAGLRSLTSLSLSLTQIYDLSPLAELKSLTWLDLFGTQVSDLSPLSELRSLSRLRLSGTPVSDLSPLSGLTSLTSLSLSGTQVYDLSPLSRLILLKALHLNNTQVSNVAPLSGLTLLQILDLENTQVSDISPLSGLSSLRYLDLYLTQVSNLSHVMHLKAEVRTMK